MPFDIYRILLDAILLAEELHQEVCDKCQKAVAIKSDDHAVYENWSAALVGLSQLNKEQETELLKEAEDIAIKAENLEKGGGAYNLACVFALRGEGDECKKWLKVSEEAGELGTLKEGMEDSDLESVKGEDWFKKLRWESKK